MPADREQSVKIVAVRRLQVPVEGSPRTNRFVQPGEEVEVSKDTAERFERLGAAAKPSSDEAKAARRDDGG